MIQQHLTGREALKAQLRELGRNVGSHLIVSLNQNQYFNCTVTEDGLSIDSKFRKWVIAEQRWAYKKEEFKDAALWEWRFQPMPIADGWRWLHNKAKRGAEVFYKANVLQGGLGNDAFVESFDIFAEDDERDLEAQRANLALFEKLTGAKITLKIFSGSKSVHAHIRLSQAVDAETWLRLNQKLCAFLGGDSAVNTLHRQMRLAGFPRIGKDGKAREVCIEEINPGAIAPDALEAALDSAWVHPYPWTSERWEKYTSAAAVLRNKAIANSTILPMQHPLDAFKLSDAELFPAPVVYAKSKHRQQGESENPWVIFEDELRSRLASMSLADQYEIGGYAHEFKERGSKLKGNSPWSENSSGETFHVFIESGAWYCHRTHTKGSISQYLKRLWFNADSLKGQEYISYVKRLASALNVAIPESCDRPSYNKSLGQSSSSPQAEANQWQSSLKGCPNKLWVEVEGEWIGSTLREVFEDLKANTRNNIGVQAPTGCGKTWSTKELAELAQAAGFQVIELQVTEALAEDQSRELGIPYRKQEGGDDSNKINPGESFVACIQALRDDCKNIDWATIVDPEKPLVLLIDEADKALSIAEKFGQHRRILGDLCHKAETTIGMSAQIKQRHMQLLADLTEIPLAESIIIHKAQPSVERQISIYERELKAPSQGLDDRNKEAALDGIGGVLQEVEQDLEKGWRVLVQTGGQRGDSKTGSMFLRAFFTEQLPEKKILEVSSQTVRDPKHPAYRIATKNNQQKAALFEKYDLIIGSPVIREGFSVEAPIDHAYVLDQGAMTVEDLIQNGGRARYAPMVTIVSTENPTQLKYGGETDPEIISKRINATATNQYNQQVLELQHGRNANLDLSSPWAKFHAEDIAQNNAGCAAKTENLERYFKDCGVDVWRAGMPPAGSGFDAALKDSFKANSTQFRTEISKAKHLSKAQLEAVEQKGELPLPIYYQVQRRKVVDAFKLDIEDILKSDGIEITLPEPEVSPILVGMERQRGLAKGWLRTSSIMGAGFWGCVAEDMARLGYPPKGWDDKPKNKIIYAPDHRQNLSAHYRLLEDIGIIELLKTFAVAQVELRDEDFEAISDSAAPERVVKAAQAAHPDKVFNLKHPQVLACARRMQEIGLDIINASLPGVSIQPNKDGSIWGGQVMTLIRNYFQAKTFYDPQKRVEGVKGSQLIVLDDKAIQLRKFVKAYDGDEPLTFEEVSEQWKTTPRRADYSDIWNVRRWKALRDLAKETGVLSEEIQNSYSNSTPETAHGARLALQLATKKREAYLEMLRIQPEVSNPTTSTRQLALLNSGEVA